MKRILFNVVFCAFIFWAGQALALTSGTTTTGSITPGGTSHQSFTGTAGQGVILYAKSASYIAVVKVYKPDGTLWTSSNERVSGTLPATGTYDVAISATSGLASGSYDLAYLRGADSVCCGSLTSGQSYNGTLAANGIASFQFAGTAGKSFLLHSAASYISYITVYKPDGSIWNSRNGRFGDTFPTTGTYTAAVTGNSASNSGAYRLDYLEGGGSVSNGKLTSGLTYDGTLALNGIDSFQFTGTAGQTFLLYSSAAYISYVGVYKPDGSFWNSGNGRFSATLPATGTYTAIVYGNSASSSGPYKLNYLRGDDTVSEGSILTASTRSGSMTANGVASYKFTGTGGSSITATSTAGFLRTISVFKPDGSFWASGSSISGTLPAVSGEYTLAFSANSGSSSGPFTLTLTTPQSAPAASTPSEVATNDCMTSVANPINFDVGFKAQTETDYNAGGLTFSRIYRSDSTWTDNTVGYFWRHNYARTLTVTMTTASITDGAGTTTTYTKSGSDWIPDDPSTTATFETSGTDYLYTLHDGTVETYDSTKKLTRIAYLGGGALNLGYNGSSQLTSVTNENGRQLTMTYSSGRLATLVTPDGTFSYSYDGNTNLDTVTKPDTKTRQYHYEDATYIHALTGITDEAGVRFATFGFDGSGKADLSKHAGNVDEYNVAYNAGGTSTTTNPLLKDTVYHFENIQGVRKVVQVDGVASTNCVASNRYYNYDSLGRVIGETDWQNNTTRYEYDDRSNVIKIVKAINTDDQQTKTITYDPAFNLPDLVTESGKTTDYDYDTYGRMVSMTVTDTATSETRITTYTYDSNTTDPNGNLVLGRLAQIDGPRTDVSDTTDFDYDANLNLTKITNALGQETEITARDSAGRPTTTEDENDVETDLAYDSNGRLQSATVAPGTALEAETDYDYDDNGNLTKVTLPNGAFVEYSYDNAQRLTGIEDALGNTITYTLDNAGNITTQDIKDSGATLKYTHDQVFDELSRIIQSVGAAAQTGVYAYDKDSNLTSYTDPETNPASYSYDALQRLVTSTDALSGVTTLGYDGLDNLASAEDQRSNSTSFTYNAFGDVTGETSPDRGAISYTVDKAGNVTSKTDARSVVTNYTWDALNRVTFAAYPADSSLNVSLTYDLTTGCGSAGVGRLCSLSDSSGVTEYEYNDLGQVTDATETRGGLTFASAYTYDLAGNVLTMTLPSGRVVTYTRNANGQVSGVSAVVSGSGTTLASSIAYLPFGPLSGLTYGNSLTFTASYDQDYYPTNRTVSTLYNYTYDTDDNGNITQAGTPVYGYDALNRLDADSTVSATSYTYDATSNRLTKVMGGTTSTTVPATSNKISAVGGTSYTYDAAGNITAIGTSGYVWSDAGLMKEAKLSGSTVGAYTYDYQNRRTKKVAGGVTTHYVYDLNGLLVGEYDNTGALLKEYVYLNGAPLAMIEAGSPEVLTYLHTNHLGTPVFGTNTGGTQVWAWAPDVFGNGAPSGSRTVNLRMPGQYYDAESSLFYNWNRYYNPATGRYISSDPIGIEGGLNTFLYVSASPVMYSDLVGLESPSVSLSLSLSNKAYPFGIGRPFYGPSIPCPGTQNQCMQDSNFQPYFGNPSLFHCGESGYTQVNAPANHQIQECFYNKRGALDTGACGGTPDDYDARRDWDMHTISDRGGIFYPFFPWPSTAARNGYQGKPQQ